jgi:segregation and condensation protein B
MTEPREPEDGREELTELGRSYDELLQREQWELDVNENVLTDHPEPVVEMPPLTEVVPPVAAAEPAKSPPPLPRIVEALLFVGGAPLTPERACETIRGLTSAEFTAVIDRLNHDYRLQGRPYSIQKQQQGYVLALRSRFRTVLDNLAGRHPREARLSPAAIDVLSLVAYRQPATKQEVDNLRGADSGALLRQLVRRGLLAVVQRGDAEQREVSYGTTARFLALFRLRSLGDLPQTQDLQRL